MVVRQDHYWQQSKEEAKRILADVLETPNMREIEFHLSASLENVMEASYRVTVSVVPKQEN